MQTAILRGELDRYSMLSNASLSILSDIPRSGCGKLSTWSEWSSCSRSCNYGQKFRLRECIKQEISDKDCEDILTDDEVCIENSCKGKCN